MGLTLNPTYIYIYIYVYLCICVCVYMYIYLYVFSGLSSNVQMWASVTYGILN